MSAIDDFKRNVTDEQQAAYYSKWVGGNPNLAVKWVVFRDAIVAGQRPDPPDMGGNAYGRGLVDMGLTYLNATATTPIPPPPPPPPPQALLTQGYTATEMQKLLTDGNLVRVAADRLVATAPTQVRFEVRPGDQYSSWSGERSQIQLPQTQGGEGDQWRWTFDFTLDPAFQFSTGFYNVLWEHHHTGSTGSPPSTLQLHGDRLVWRQAKVGDPAQSNYWTETDLAAAQPGVNHKVLVDCILSTDPAKAKTAVTVDGKTTVLGGSNLLDGMRVYVEWGLYRAPAQVVQAVSFGPASRLA